jgi:hypothetical protein
MPSAPICRNTCWPGLLPCSVAFEGPWAREWALQEPFFLQAVAHLSAIRPMPAFLRSRLVIQHSVGFMKLWHQLGMTLAAAALSACGGGGNTAVPEPGVLPPGPAAFTQPKRVALLDYTDSAMEPFVSPDGRYIFFNNSNAADTNTNLRYAERIDDLTYQYRGPIRGANSGALDGVPSMDRNGLLYFISLRTAATTQASVYRGQFADGALTGVALVQGVAPTGIALLDFDASISHDGNQLYVAEGVFVFLSVPLAANIVLFERQGTGFVRAANSDQIMQQLNTGNVAYAPTVSRSGLEIFFNRVENGATWIYTASRAAATLPFGPSQRVASIDSSAEGPTLSPDEKSLYYHRLEGSQYVLYRVTRP